MYAGVVAEAMTRELRRRVLRPHLGPDDPLPGDEVPDAVHVAVLAEDGMPLSTCFLYAEACPWHPAHAGWHLRQMATDERHRGEGHGARVVDFAAGYVAGQGGEILWCNARATAAGFYERYGFRTHGDVFTDERHTIPHYRMWRSVAPG